MDTNSLYDGPAGSSPGTAGQPAADQSTASPPGPRLFYANVEQFVTELIAHQYMRPVDSSGRNTRWTWCASWWRHREAVSRLNALWRAWEALRLDPTTGMAVWWRDFADPTMAVLFSETGPFRGCTPEHHNPKDGPLPLIPPPKGLFPRADV